MLISSYFIFLFPILGNVLNGQFIAGNLKAGIHLFSGLGLVLLSISNRRARMAGMGQWVF
jgi:hypothetical protein